MKITLGDKIISILCYYTFGIFGIIWLVIAHVMRKRIHSFVMFNISQSIFISILLAVLSLLYGIATNFLIPIPFIGKAVAWFDVFFNQTPLYFTFTLSGFLTTLLIVYLSVVCLIGKKPVVPLVSDIVDANFGG